MSADVIMAVPKADPPIDVVVLAGGLNAIPLYDGYVPGYKALIAYKGRTSIDYVLDALRASPGIGRICIAGPRTLLEDTLSHRPAGGGITTVEGGATFLDSLIVGLEHFRSSRAVLFVTADMPLLTTGAVTDFLAGCAAAPTSRAQNIHVAAVPRTCYQGHYLTMTKPFNRYADIQVCHGNLFLIDTDLVDNQELRKRVAVMYDGRKTGLSRLAFGWQVALTYLIGVDLLHILTLRYMAERVSRLFGIGVIPVLVSHPEITVDVDGPEDYTFVQDQLRQPVKSQPG